MKKTLNPFENAKRIANGAGGVSPAIIEEIQGEITILGSQNTQQAQDITDIKTQLTELAGAYSITEHKTGRKWTDGKDVWEQTIIFDTELNVSTSWTSTLIPKDIYNEIITASAIRNTGANYAIDVNIGTTYLQLQRYETTPIKKLVITYTKTGA